MNAVALTRFQKDDSLLFVANSVQTETQRQSIAAYSVVLLT